MFLENLGIVNVPHGDTATIEVGDNRGDELLTYLGEIYFKTDGPVDVVITVQNRQDIGYKFNVRNTTKVTHRPSLRAPLAPTPVTIDNTWKFMFLHYVNNIHVICCST